MSKFVQAGYRIE